MDLPSSCNRHLSLPFMEVQGLSEIYAAEGQKGLTVRSSVCSTSMPSSWSHKSLDRYRYACATPLPPVLPSTRNLWGQDRRTLRADGRSRPENRLVQTHGKGKRNTEPMSGTCGKRCILKSPSGAGNTTGSRKTKIWNDKEVSLWLQSTSLSRSCTAAQGGTSRETRRLGRAFILCLPHYKCRFDEQLLIYAQRPDATASCRDWH